MEITKKWIKNNLLFFISLIVLIISVTFSITIIASPQTSAGAESTRVAHIYLGDNTNGYSSILNDATNDFKTKETYEINYQNNTTAFDLSLVRLNLNETLSQIKPNTNNLAFFELIDQTAFQNELSLTFGDDILTQIDVTQLFNDLTYHLNRYHYLVHINLDNYMKEDFINTILTEKLYDVPSIELYDKLPDNLELTIEGMSMFSLIDQFADYSLDNETLSYLASIILDTSLKTHFNYYLFNSLNNNSTLVDVMILNNSGYDLQFYNSFDQEFQIQLIKENQQITVKIIGSPSIYTYDTYENIQVINYDTVYINDSNLLDPIYITEDTLEHTIYQKILTPGVDGNVIQTIRLTTLTNGDIISETLFYQYNPVINQVVSENVVLKEVE